MSNTPEYWQAFYTVQALILNLAPTYTQPHLNTLAHKITEQIEAIYVTNK